MFAPSIAFVDLETTGTTPGEDRVTEVGIVRVDGVAQISEWSSLVNPECSIPPAIQALTGITNAMVAHAPTFAQIADEVAQRIAGCVFVAHNARFDYGFLKHEFGRLRRPFTAKVLCTVKLSRRLYPQSSRHNLDTIIERHALQAEERHRALGDARVLWRFVQQLYREKPVDEVDEAIARMLKAPSLPSQLPADVLTHIPEAPGVYRFYGLNPLPLYVGKSINLRERIATHFSGDYRSANDLRISAEITRIEIERTAGELGALLRESQLIKTLLPTYNHRLRRRRDMVAIALSQQPAPPEYINSAAIEPGSLEGLYGPSLRVPRRARHCAKSPRTLGSAGARWDSNAASARALPVRSSVVTARASASKRSKRTRRACAVRCLPVRCDDGPIRGWSPCERRTSWESGQMSTSFTTGAGSALRMTTLPWAPSSMHHHEAISSSTSIVCWSRNFPA